jgi:hypothetical protein
MNMLVGKVVINQNGMKVISFDDTDWQNLQVGASIYTGDPETASELLDCLQRLLWTRTQERGLRGAPLGDCPLHDRCKAAILKAGGRVL